MNNHFISYVLAYHLVNKPNISNIDDKSDEIGRLKKGNYAKLKFKQKQINCPILFSSAVHDEPAPTFMEKPFKTIPPFMEKDYTYDGRIKVNSWYIENNFPTNRTSSKCEFIPSSNSQLISMLHNT